MRLASFFCVFTQTIFAHFHSTHIFIKTDPMSFHTQPICDWIFNLADMFTPWTYSSHAICPTLILPFSVLFFSPFHVCEFLPYFGWADFAFLILRNCVWIVCWDGVCCEHLDTLLTHWTANHILNNTLVWTNTIAIFCNIFQ